EPIYRLLFDAMPDDVIEKLKAISNTAPLGANKCEYEIYCGGEYNAVTIESEHGLPVKALQLFLDEYTAKYGGRLDYVHGKAETIELAKNAGAIGFVFETMKKSELFSAVAKEGALPRKTFSMGEARDKRFYIECRKIK
ncbi:MAG: DUF1015 domain-containing protein, partial [Oscillospiraceae bacterium]|nr:DUF1015 domain-containing protein [Oscillospiraceae bacterium]